MIEKLFPSKRTFPSTITTALPWVSQAANNLEIIPEVKNGSFVFEKIRRDKIIREAYKNCKWKVGDFVMPYSKEEQKRWGAEKCRVTGIARNLIEFGEDDWPKTDNPMIVCVHIEGTTKSFYCTPEYLVIYEAEAAKT